jgi:DNA-3-methyladenine glycosylase II
MILQLNETNLIQASNYLAAQDESLQNVLQRLGTPPLWARQPGFSTLIHIILEQQVSLASANAAFHKLCRICPNLNPESFLLLHDDNLSAIGFSRQKIRYTRLLAEAIRSGLFQLDQLSEMDDEAASGYLQRLKGIGAWTADIYLMECLMRPDILPKGDIALLEAFRDLKGLEKRPEHPQLIEATAHWRPWRSVGVRMLWQHYLDARGRPLILHPPPTLS